MVSYKLSVYFSAVLVQILLAIGQISLKILAKRIQSVGLAASKNLPDFIFVATPFSAALFTYFLVAILWLYVLQHLPLSAAFLFVSLSFVFVPLFSSIFLGEVISSGVLIATPLIVVALIISIFIK